MIGSGGAFNKQRITLGNEPIENGQSTQVGMGLEKFTVMNERLNTHSDALASRIEISQRLKNVPIIEKMARTRWQTGLEAVLVGNRDRRHHNQAE